MQQLAVRPDNFTLQNVASQRMYIDGQHQNVTIELTDQDKKDIAGVLGGRGYSKTAINRFLNSFPNIGLSAWWLERIMYNTYQGKGRWSYCAGQDYPHELNLIRKDIRNKF